eukprot:5550115-Pleurochrysis_carterae.AAC.2
MATRLRAGAHAKLRLYSALPTWTPRERGCARRSAEGAEERASGRRSGMDSIRVKWKSIEVAWTRLERSGLDRS